MVAWGLIVSSIDNVIKPMIIGHSSDMPFILILLGVLGGAAAFGLIGVFLGPTLLAVGLRLLKEWTAQRQQSVSQGRVETASIAEAALSARQQQESRLAPAISGGSGD